MDELRKLVSCPVTYMVLCHAGLKDSDLEVLVEWTALKTLNLSGNAGITDTGLEYLEKISSLDTLYLQNTSVTREGIGAFRKKRPDVTVYTH